MSTVTNSALRVHFLDYLFGDTNGYICIATANRTKDEFKQHFYEWPSRRQEVANFIDSMFRTHNVWFCVNMLSKPERKKEYCLPSSVVWADLDYKNPDGIEPKPSSVIQSSPGRYQAYWRVEGDPLPADVAEDFSRRIAYKFDADKSGWDLTQLLRVPLTLNHKYEPPVEISILSVLETPVPVELLDAIEPPTSAANTNEAIVRVPMPNPDTLPVADHVLYHYKAMGKLTDEFVTLYTRQPLALEDWSKLIWRFINLCLEMQMTAEETFSLSMTAACNKYKRDNRPISYLWRDIVKAADDNNRFNILMSSEVDQVLMPTLVDPDKIVEDSFISDYKEWANIATDAPEQYHELTAFVTLSSVLSAGLYLELPWGKFSPNIWGLILGESTLTRKTTAMRLGIDMIKELDDELIVATDGSAEGLLQGLSLRPNQVSIFYKDEITGLFDSMNKKDYLSGLSETFTELYDSKIIVRRLRKETISIRDPYFIFFGGGIRDKVYSLINDHYVMSGFLPRFLIVSGENDLARLRRTGPPTEVNTSSKERVVSRLADLKEQYNLVMPTNILGQTIMTRARIEAKLTPEAWELNGDYESKLVTAGAESNMQMLALPTFQRLGFSLLKMAMLIAATRRAPNDSNILMVERNDVEQAAYYVQKWGGYSIDLLINTGKSMAERTIERTLNKIRRTPGVTKSIVMQHLHLSAREAKELIDTMQERGLIEVKKSGGGIRLYPVH